MPLASSLSASQQRAKNAEMERKELERRQRINGNGRRSSRRLSLPAHSTNSASSAATSTRNSSNGSKPVPHVKAESDGDAVVTTSDTTTSTVVASIAKVDPFRAMRKQYSASSLNTGNRKKRHSICITSSSGNSSSNSPRRPFCKENAFGPNYSPPLTRSAKKKKMDDLAFFVAANNMDGSTPRRANKSMASSSSSVASSVLLFSPPNLAENERAEQERLRRKEVERKLKIEQARRDGQAFLVPLRDAPIQNKDEVAAAAAAAAAAAEKMQAMQHELDSVKADHSELESKYHALQQTADMAANAAVQIKSMQKELDNAKTARSEIEASCERLQQDAASAADATVAMQAAQQELVTIKEAHGELESSHQTLRETVVTYQERMERYERDIVPTLESNLETERDAVARLEAQAESLLAEVEECRQEKERLEQELVTVQRRADDERDNGMNQVAETSNQMAALTKDYDEQIQTLTNQLEESRRKLAESQANLETVQEALSQQNKQLNDALEETMTQLEQVEREKTELEATYQSTVTQLNAANATVARNGMATDAAVQELTLELSSVQDQLQALRKERDAIVSEKDHAIAQLQQQVKITTEERDLARHNMQGFNEREADLLQKMRDANVVRREMHNRLMQLMGNIRVFVRVRPVLAHEMAAMAASSNTNKVAGTSTTGVRPMIASNRGISSSAVKKRKREDDDVSPFSYPDDIGASRSAHAAGTVGSNKQQRCVTTSAGVDLTKNLIDVLEPYKDRGGLKDRRKKWRFGFDRVLTPDHGQEDVWEATKPLIQCVVDGSDVTVFAYGQTGSGKTHTMLGEDGSSGLIGRSVQMLFDEKREMEALTEGETTVTMAVELLEVYNEKIRDLLTDTKEQDLKLLANEVVGNRTVDTESVEDVMRILKLAQNRRCVKSTNSNSESSRSHMIFTLHFNVHQTVGDEEQIRRGKLNICDLAGSERLDKSGAHMIGGALLEESKNINMSLSVLSNVIERLQVGDANVPYRESKLTMLLKNSLSGKNSKTLAIACCNPLAAHMNESLCTLRFAEKVNRVELKGVSSFEA